ncbi:hypothetical protein [Thiosocius teredinicola]|uniref:hypothetical protein n=1 Tax=Thiosocius teredinicola TaxID=1973002 RepID=UPI000F7B5E7E
MRRPISLLFILVGIAVALNACVYAPPHERPPAHRYDYDYYYYPDVNVYFHLFSGHYYYRDHDRWLRVKVLPSHIYLDHRVRRPLMIKEPQPYRHHERHRAEYRPPANYRREPKYDRAERDHNRRQFEVYHGRRGDAPPRPR